MKVDKKMIRTYKTILHGQEVEVKVYEAYTKEEFDEAEKKRNDREHELALLGNEIITEIDEQRIKNILKDIH